MKIRRATPDQITRLKARRDELLNRRCTLRERRRILQRVQLINRQIRAIEQRLGWR